MNNVDKFEKIFNELHTTLSKNLGHSKKGNFGKCLEQIKKSPWHPAFHFVDELDVARQIRNLIVHEKSKNFSNVVIPSEEIIQKLIDANNKIKYPMTTHDFLKKEIQQEEITCFYSNQNLTEVFEKIDSLNYSQFPLFDENGYLGLISENGLTKWIASNIKMSEDKIENLSRIKINELKQIDEINQSLDYLCKEENIYNLAKMFDNPLTKTVIVCNNPCKKITSPADIFGIVTLYDLKKLYRILS